MTNPTGDALVARIKELEEALQKISDPLKITINGIGTERALKLILEMSNIARKALNK